MSQTTLQALKEATPAFTILSHPVRQQILLLLFDRGPQSVSELTVALKMTQPNMSYHLRQLERAHLVTMARSGRHRLYSVDTQTIMTILENTIQRLRLDMAKANAAAQREDH